MSSPLFSSYKNQLIIPISISSVFLLVLRFCGCYNCSLCSSLLLLALSTSLAFIFSKIKHLMVSSTIEEPTSSLNICLNTGIQEEEDGDLHIDEMVHSIEECPSLENDNDVNILLQGPTSSSDPCLNTGIQEEEDGHLYSTEMVLSKEEYPPLPNDNDNPLSDGLVSNETLNSSDCSMSDDESLIEIALENEPNAVLLPELMPEFSVELLFKKHGLTELLAEINEVDNMIEIDIALASIKCSRFEIEA